MFCFSKVKTHFEALHNYPEAPDKVSFLKSKHRHIFEVVLWIEERGDRELEYFMVRQELNKFLDLQLRTRSTFGVLTDLGSMSCEQIARLIYEWAMDKYGGRRLKVEVTEDGENGCLIE